MEPEKDKAFHSKENDALNGLENFDDITLKSSLPIKCASNIVDGNELEMKDLFHFINSLHSERVQTIEEDENLDRNDKNEQKVMILEKYVHQLKEQNEIFISTMMELEKEVNGRVVQMDKRLKSSAKSTMEAVINVHECASIMKKLVNARMYIETLYNDLQANFSALKVENSLLRDYNFNLNHDIQALLQVIQCARSTGHWEMNCDTFCEVTPEQVFGLVQPLSNVSEFDSSQVEFNLPEPCSKVPNCSDSSSLERDVFSCNSSPCTDQSIKQASHDDHSKSNARYNFYKQILKKDHKIAHLNKCIVKLRHQLSSKEAECECHLWKLGVLMGQNENTQNFSPSTLFSNDVPQLKCISLPDIGNIYNNKYKIRKYQSLRILKNSYNENLNYSRKTEFIDAKCNEACDSGIEKYKSFLKKNYGSLNNHKSQSEPHIFMFGDNIYVYRPCEPSVKTSNDYFPETDVVFPYQSIDLQFPTETISKSLDWSHTQNNESTIIPEEENYKLTSVVFNSNSGLDLGKIKYNHALKKRIISKTSMCCQTEEISKHSLGLQVSIPFQYLNEHDEESHHKNIPHMINRIKILEDTLQKSKNKIEEKDVLIEQLHGHISASVKEVELKDKVLENIERKLLNSRNECTSLKQEVSKLRKEIDENLNNLDTTKMMCDNLQLKLDAKEDKFQTVLNENNILQDQKRSLLTQLDAQGDLFENQKQELQIWKHKTENFSLHMEQQSHIIKNLQDALVHSKRALDATKMPSNMQSVPCENKSSSRSSIVDI